MEMRIRIGTGISISTGTTIEGLVMEEGQVLGGGRGGSFLATFSGDH